DVVSALVADSLVVRADGRCHMLATIRDFAREQLEESGEADRLLERHVDYFLALAERAEEELLTGAERGPWLDRLAAEHDNLRAALAWAPDPERALRLAAALRLFWELRGHLREGCAFLDAALARPGEHPPEARARALNAAAVMVYRQGDVDRTRD